MNVNSYRDAFISWGQFHQSIYQWALLSQEIWHLPERTTAQNKMIKNASANALRIITNEINIYHTHTEIHQMTKRALPDQLIKYKHALMMHKLFRQCMPDIEFMHLNFTKVHSRKQHPSQQNAMLEQHYHQSNDR